MERDNKRLPIISNSIKTGARYIITKILNFDVIDKEVRVGDFIMIEDIKFDHSPEKYILSISGDRVHPDTGVTSWSVIKNLYRETVNELDLITNNFETKLDLDFCKSLISKHERDITELKVLYLYNMVGDKEL